VRWGRKDSTYSKRLRKVLESLIPRPIDNKKKRRGKSLTLMGQGICKRIGRRTSSSGSARDRGMRRRTSSGQNQSPGAGVSSEGGGNSIGSQHMDPGKERRGGVRGRVYWIEKVE